jgi:hypothetical protein
LCRRQSENLEIDIPISDASEKKLSGMPRLLGEGKADIVFPEFKFLTRQISRF